MKKRLGVLALATAMLLGMTGCGGQKEVFDAVFHGFGGLC